MEIIPLRIKIKNLFSELRDYNRIAEIGTIARRYFLINTFDGVMTVLGIILGNWMAGSDNPAVILKIGFATSISIAISGVWGAYAAETSERIREIKNMSRAVMKNIGNTKIGRAHRFASFVIAIVDGIAPILTAVLLLLPFFFTQLSIGKMYAASILLSFFVLAVLGVFSAAISKEKIFPSVIRMVLAGVTSAVVGHLILNS
ncbi:MAG: hypothetical protein QXW00_03990 [Candidatus Woesearchaeota archaeon]